MPASEAGAPPAPFRLYNTLSRQVEPFEPLVPGHVSIYACGMTVYDHAHVGHARAFVVFDAFVRWLRTGGWSVRFVRNYTDVDDKIIRRAAELGEDPFALAQRYIDDFRADCDALELAPPEAEPRVTTSMDDILAMIGELVAKGHAYAQGGSVWFRVDSFADYGQLSGQRPDKVCAAPDTGDKADPRDFALWKAAKDGEPSWPSPWGPGRPGWHIECSAMARSCLGHTIDIHGGGLDLVFPHHENEIAQSTCANGQPFSRWWMHNGLLTLVKHTADGVVQDVKMGKSLGNVVNIRDALQQVPAEALRLYYLQAHYRSPLPWTDDALTEALAMLARLYEARELAARMQGEGDADRVAEALGADAQEVLSLGRAFPERFAQALADDFNTSAALGLAFELTRALNRLANHKKAASRGGPVVGPALEALAHLSVLGLLTRTSEAFDEEVKDKRLAALGIDRAHVEQLLAQRTQARADKDWARADALRAELDALRIVVMDRPGGVAWKLRLTEG
ncbi:MAG: cysteine--tRNA ligase [Alphaproteobacteria bacterium]|nr:cysteine--tRNA ligase [Alphaproteobacteria bacterium]